MRRGLLALCSAGAIGAALSVFGPGAALAAAPPAGTAIPNVAHGTGTFTGVPLVVDSNPVVTIVQSSPVPAPRVRYFAAATYAQEIRVGRSGQPLFVQVDAPGWDRDPAAPDTASVTLATLRTGDRETFLAIETGPSTGVFRIAPDVPTGTAPPPGSTAATPAVTGDRIVTTARGDLVTATVVPETPAGTRGPGTAEAELWMDPSSLAFDAASDRPAAGVVVALVDVTGQGNGGVPGGPARVFAADGVSPAPASVVTDAAGAFTFAFVPKSTYRLAVTPGAGRKFPSSIAPAALPAGHVIDALGSYGSAFPVSDSLAPLVVDLPLDAGGDVLFVEKTASSPDVELGETVDYDVRVVNRGAGPLDSVSVFDALPAGFAYVAGTARLDGARIADPAGGGGPALAFALGTLAPGTPRLVRYRARVGAGARDGDGVNRAWAARGATVSNVATARVKLTGGVFAEEATVLGTVFVDMDHDGHLGPGDIGLPGVRLYLDDGSFAVTDQDGRYSMYGISPRTHALKVDPVTLPHGAHAVSTDVRGGAREGLAFVDATRGDFVRSDWAVTSADTALAAAARARTTSPVSPTPDELAREVALGAAPLEARGNEPDARGLPASAITTGESRLPLFAPSAAAGAAPSAAAPDTAAAAPADTGLAALGPALGFVDFAATDTVASPQARVRVKGPFGATFHLWVNGGEIAKDRVGKRVEGRAAGVTLWEYVGVPLAPGTNDLVLTADLDGAGTHPAPAHARVVAPDRPGRIVVLAPRVVPADGFTPARITLRIVDARGVPIASRTLVTLESSLGRLVGEDLDPVAGGLQVAVEGGQATVSLFAQGAPGVAEVRAVAGDLAGSARIAFVPDLRPFIAVGSLEGTLALSHTSGGAGSVLVRPGPAFEAPMGTFTSTGKDGDQFAGVRGALFVKGRIKDDVLLTLGYDSDRPKDLRRLRDIQPDAYYPLYGDASVKGYEARSTENLYARLDRRGASLLFGDYDTPVAGPGSGRSLAAYSRSLSGFASSYETHALRVNGWTSKDHTRRKVDEIRGRGVSGPYTLAVAPLVENTERVEIIVRDRDQPSLVRTVSARQRFVDYEIDPLTGALLMKAPVPSVDADLNPVYLRVTYEVDSGGDPFWVTGLDARARVTGALEIGGTYVDDHDPVAGSELRSVFAAAKLAPGSTLEGEIASTHSARSGTGEAARFEWRHVAQGVEARVYGSSTGAHFDNPSAGFAAGRAEAGARFTLALSPKSRVLVDGIYTAAAAGRARQGGLLLALDRKLGSMWRAEIGTRLAGSADRDSAHTPFEVALRAKATAQLPGKSGASAYAEFEQDTRQTDRRLLAVGAETRVLARGRLYMRHEILSSFVGPFATDEAQQQHTTVFGMDANVTPEARVFSEYRADGLFGAREGEAAVGLANAWRLASGARVNATLERVQPLGEVANASPAVAGAIASPGASTAVTVAVDYSADPRWKGSGRSEFRTGRTGDGMLATFAGAYRLGVRWSALARSAFSVNDDASGLFTLRERAQLGFAYRPSAGWDALGRYELHYDATSGTTPGATGRKLAHVVSLHTDGPLGPRASGAFAWAGKLAWDGTGGASSFTTAHWVHGRAAWAVGRLWDAGVTTGVIAATRSRRGGAGLEVGRKLDTDVWLSLGYNVVGYADDDLTGEEWTRRGAYLRVRARFDETLWRGARP